jgi:uncharacterized protein (DUF488 family)
MTKLYTIGFTKKSASTFFGLLQKSGAKCLVDVRLNNVSQLAGFAKRDDLSYFLGELCGMDYRHDLRLAPTKTMLDAYKKHNASWADYEKLFVDLIRERRIEDVVHPESLDNAVLLCSEATPHQCHRRLVAEYLAERWEGVTIHHL